MNTCLKHIVVFLLVLFSQRTTMAVTYSVTDLGSLSDGGYGIDNNFGFVSGINSEGQVIGGVGFGPSGDGYYHGFRTAPNSVINLATDDLGTLLAASNIPMGINDNGQVAGHSENPGAYIPYPFRTAPNSPINPSTDRIFPIDVSGTAFGINNSGQVVGGRPAYRTSPNSPFNPATDVLLSGYFYSGASAINDGGQVVGIFQHQFVDNFRGAFRTAPNSPVNLATDILGTLGGQQIPRPSGINNVGQVVGTDYLADNSTQRAFRTSPNAPIDPNTDDLGTLGGTSSYGLAINNSGQVVGGSYIAGNSAYHAFICNGSTMSDLNALIDSNSGWTLTEAKAINDSGQIACTGYSNGVVHAFLLTPNPEIKPPTNSVPPRLNVPEIPAPTAGKTGLIFITHGWNSDKDAWATNLALQIASWIDPDFAEVMPGIQFTAGDWDIVAYDWREWARGKPEGAALKALAIGRQLGQQLLVSPYTKFHLIAHSAGSWMIDAIADAFQGSGKTVHVTFLDPYEPEIINLGTLGDSATFAEQYLDHRGDVWDYVASGGSAGATLSHTYNIDVTNLDPNLGGLFNPRAWHAWPYQWYSATVDPSYPLSQSWGLSRSQELGALPSHASLHRGDTITLTPPNPPQLYVTTPAVINQPGANLDFSSLQLQFSLTGTKDIFGTSFQMVTESPVWVAALVPVTGLVNYVTFKVDFTSDPGAEGLLAVYWDGNLIGEVDERYAADGFQEYAFPLPGLYNANSYTLAFRMDRFTTTQSKVMIKDVTTGFVESKYPPLASFNATPTNGVAPLLVTLTNTTSTLSGPITNQFWDFGDGQTTNTAASSVTHLYGTAGTWTVALTVSGVFGSSSVTKPILIESYLDTDSDGIPDWWTQQYFNHPTGQAGDLSRAGDDADGDGRNNLTEFLAGTDPKNSVSAFRITVVEKIGGDIRVSFTSVGRKYYCLERCDFMGGAWTNLLDNIAGNDSVQQATDIGGATRPIGFYRVRLGQANASPQADSVGDGIPDSWRQQYFGSGDTTNSNSCASCDPDGDSMSNAQEYLVGTEPLNPESKFGITSITPNPGGGFTIQWSSVDGKLYDVQRDTSLSWSTVLTLSNNVAATPPTNTYTDPSATNAPAYFFRVWLKL